MQLSIYYTAGSAADVSHRKNDWPINKNDSSTKTINETHHMRYFFCPEVKEYLKQAGFEMLEVLDCNTALLKNLWVKSAWKLDNTGLKVIFNRDSQFWKRKVTQRHLRFEVKITPLEREKECRNQKNHFCENCTKREAVRRMNVWWRQRDKWPGNNEPEIEACKGYTGFSGHLLKQNICRIHNKLLWINHEGLLSGIEDGCQSRTYSRTEASEPWKEAVTRKNGLNWIKDMAEKRSATDASEGMY